MRISLTRHERMRFKPCRCEVVGMRRGGDVASGQVVTVLLRVADEFGDVGGQLGPELGKVMVPAVDFLLAYGTSSPSRGSAKKATTTDQILTTGKWASTPERGAGNEINIGTQAILP